MRDEELVIGNGYVPISKSYVIELGVLGVCEEWIRAKARSQKFLYYIGIKEGIVNIDGIVHVFSADMNTSRGAAYFMAADVIPYIEPVGNLLPFDLDIANKEPDRVTYGNGAKPIQWTWFDKTPHQWCIVSVGEKSHYCHLKNGLQSENGTYSEWDLMLAPLPEYQYQINIYRSENTYALSAGTIYALNSYRIDTEVEIMKSNGYILKESLIFKS